MWLPTALSLQVDYNINGDFYLGSALVQSIPLGNFKVGRANVFALSPRFERKWFGASLPISIYNWDQVRVGLSARLGFLTLGSDHIGSIFTNSDLSGTDFYMALKIFPFGKGNGGSGGKGRSRFGKNRDADCYKF